MKKTITIPQNRQSFTLPAPFPLVAGDVNAYEVVLPLSEDASGAQLTVQAKRANNQVVTDMVQINGTEARYTLKSNMYDIAGGLFLRLQVVEDGSILSECQLDCEVLEAYGSDVTADDRLPALSSAIAQTQEAAAAANGAAQTANEAAAAAADAASRVPDAETMETIVTDAHTHANASVLDATTAAYTAAEKTKLSGVAAGANNYVHPASHSADMISTTASKRFTSDAEMAQKADKSYVDGALYDKADGAAVYAALDTKADKTAVDAIAPKAHTHANATVLDAITAASLVGTKGVNIDSPGNDVTDLDSLPNGLTQVPYSDGAGAGGYLVFTSLERGGGNVGYQIKLSTDATLWRWCSYGEWGAWQMQTDALLAPIVTKTDAGTAFYFASPGVYQLQRTTDTAKQLTFYTPSDAQKTKVNELELYLTVTAGDSVLWPAGTLFAGGEIPTFTPGHYYRVIAEYHPLAQAWAVGVVEDFAAV